MSAKRTSWNEFSSSMASVVIYLSLGVVSATDDVVHPVDEEPSIPSPTPPTPPPQLSYDIPSSSQDARISMNLLQNLMDTYEDVVLEDAKDVAVEKSVDVDDNADIQGRIAESQAQIY
nr:hypothetical protein [Tanacetum cinerariifolium]